MHNSRDFISPNSKESHSVQHAYLLGVTVSTTTWLMHMLSVESTHPWGAPVLTVRVLDVISPSLTCCFLSVRKFVIHWQVVAGTVSWVSLVRRTSGMMVLNAELKSTNSILAYVTVKIWFLPLASFLCYFIILSMCICHAVGEIVTSRGYACWTEWLSSEFGGLESRLINWRTGHTSPAFFWKLHNADEFKGVTHSYSVPSSVVCVFF